MTQGIGEQRGGALDVFACPDGLAQYPVRANTTKREIADERHELAGDVEMRVEFTADAFDGHERADQEHQVGGNLKVVGPDYSHELLEQYRQVDRLESELGVRRHQFGDVA